MGLLIIFGLTAVPCLLLAAVIDSERWAAVKDLLQILLPAEMGLLGSAAGFYFGSRIGNQK